MMMAEFSLWDIIRNLITGLEWTVGLSLTAFLFGGIVGVLVLSARIGRFPWLRRVMKGYIELFQGTPLLMQLFLVFFGISLIGLRLPALLPCPIGLTLFTSAYLAEIWRGCV